MSEDRNAPPPADDLRSLLAAATKENVREATAPPPAVNPPAAGREDVKQPEIEAPADGSVEAEDRQSSLDLGQPSEPPAASEEPGEAPAEGERAAAKAPATGAAEAPQHWAQADKDKFAALPPEARSTFLDLYKRMETGFTPKLQRGAQLERDYGELDRSVFTPEQRHLLSQKGVSVPAMVNAWANVERSLGGAWAATDPRSLAIAEDARDDMAARIIHNYQCNVVNVANKLNAYQGFAAQRASSDAAAAANGNGAVRSPVDPVLAARLEKLENEQRVRAQTEQNNAMTSINQKLNEFSNEVDENGQPKHPFFADEKIQLQMTKFAKEDQDEGKVPDLSDLYTRAVWANAETREKQLASQREAEAKRQADERKAQSERARRAGSSITGAPIPGGPQSGGSGDLSLRDQIKANMQTRPQTSGGRGRI